MARLLATPTLASPTGGGRHDSSWEGQVADLLKRYPTTPDVRAGSECAR
jgi:hypothetical protein